MINDNNATIYLLEFCLNSEQNSEETRKNSSITWQFKILKVNIMRENYIGFLY